MMRELNGPVNGPTLGLRETNGHSIAKDESEMRRFSVALSTVALLFAGTAIVACGSGDGSSTPTADTDQPDTASPDTTSPDSTTPDSTTPDGTTCEPLCLAGWECGPDGCGGSCGDCASGTSCNQAKHKCEEDGPPPPETAEFGEQCGRKGDCQPYVPNATTGDLEENPQWPACIHAQCATGVCDEPVCTKPCTLTQDQKDSAGNPGADGIDDPDAPFNDCAGAVDGILGDNFTCVNVAPLDNPQPQTMCYAGTTFKECFVNADCPEGESCQIAYITGTFSLRCLSAPKGAQPVATDCNLNPEDGDIALCEAHCYGIGCVGFCQGNSDCHTFENGCGANGKCTDNPETDCATDDDCSAWTCNPAHNHGSEENPVVFDTCWPRTCDKNAGCRDDDFFCRPFVNGGDTIATLDWENLCVPKPANSADLGGQCEDDPEDNIDKPDCGTGWCLNNGVCSAICELDADCANDNTEMLCGVNEFPFDFDDDDNYDAYLPLGLCMAFPGTKTTCTSNAECTVASEACKFIEQKDEVTGVYDGSGKCAEVDDTAGDIGSPCGGNSGINCKAGFCFGTDGDQPGWCSGLCSKTSDCPQNLALGPFAGPYNLGCVPYGYGEAGTADVTDDDVYVSICFPAALALGKSIPGAGVLMQFLTAGETNQTSSSMTDCSGTLYCTNPNEACIAFPTAQGATGPTHVDYLCVNNKQNFVENNQQVTVDPTAAVGEECTLNIEDKTATLCHDLYCLPDVGGNGYCSRLCVNDNDCGGGALKCEDIVVIDRADDSQDLTVKACRKTAMCSPCGNQNDCGNGYSCVNLGGPGLLASYGCAPSCTASTDCTGTDGAASCSDSKDSKGIDEGVKACFTQGGGDC